MSDHGLTIGWPTGLLALAVACAGCRGPESPADGAELSNKAGEAVAVPVIHPERATLERSTTQPATVHADHQAEIFAKAAGYLEELRADIGDTVEAGQVLGIIGVPELDRSVERQEAEIRRLEADERRADAEVELAGADIEAAAASLEQAKADVDRARAHREAARSELERTRGLVDEGAVTPRLLDETQRRYEAASADAASAVAAVTTAEAGVDVARAARDAAVARAETTGAETAVARKALEELDATRSFATLKAPFDGVVIDRQVDPGDLVRNIQAAATGGDQPPLFVVAKLDRVRVQVPLPEDDAPLADVGDPVAVTLRALLGRRLEGAISRLARGLDPSTRTMLVEVDLPNPELDLMPGMFGEATVILERREGLVLPAGAVRYDEVGRSYVYLVDAEDRIRVVDVATGLDDGNRIEIVGGLAGDERVVGPMIDRLDEGQRVRVAPPKQD